ncbi:uncharacterized protein LOC100211407 [Hydra vulgaris]|uniref:uncharacterized protein LOC100211407 n=1 Tax=Hydra vulgaris TaxID=6087 RepID=UPI0001926AA5|nr:uncharacterized protein LOC100211407 [Hydra vulgaris]
MSKSSRFNCIAVDDSLASEQAFLWYLENYHRTEDTLLIIHIHCMPPMPTSSSVCEDFNSTQNYYKIVEASITNSKRVLEKFQTLCEKLSIKYKVVLGDDSYFPGYMICELSIEHNASVIIVGTREQSEKSNTYLGSITYYLLHNGRIPVVTIPEIKN